jgi:EAL domain-containing protein (putative c-di-GMP-specific phosphodiesterase class I)
VRRAAAWLKGKRDTRPLYVSVNLSTGDLERPDLVPFVIGLIGDAGIEASALQLEITEQSLIKDFNRSEQNLAMLRQLGCRIAIDDFGTGYSSLSYIGRLPADVLKLDRQFVNDICTNSTSRTIAEMTIELAKRLGLSVIAEGVETSEQSAVLQSIGYKYGQGYLYGRAMPAEQLEMALDS